MSDGKVNPTISTTAPSPASPLSGVVGKLTRKSSLDAISPPLSPRVFLTGGGSTGTTVAPAQSALDAKIKFRTVILVYILFFASCFVVLGIARPVSVMHFVRLTVGNPPLNLSALPVDGSLLPAPWTTTATPAAVPNSAAASLRETTAVAAAAAFSSRRAAQLSDSSGDGSSNPDDGADGGGDAGNVGKNNKNRQSSGVAEKAKRQKQGKKASSTAPIPAVTTREPDFLVPPRKVAPGSAELAALEAYFRDVRLTTKTRMICPWAFLFDYPIAYFLTDVLDMKLVPGLDANVISLSHPLFAFACVYFLLTSVAEVPATSENTVGSDESNSNNNNGNGDAAPSGLIATATSIDGVVGSTSCVADSAPVIVASTASGSVDSVNSNNNGNGAKSLTMRRTHSRALSLSASVTAIGDMHSGSGGVGVDAEMRTIGGTTMMGSASGSSDAIGASALHDASAATATATAAATTTRGSAISPTELVSPTQQQQQAAAETIGNSPPQQPGISAPTDPASVVASIIYNIGQTRVLHFPRRLKYAAACLLARNFLDTFDGVMARSQRLAGISKRGPLKDVDGHMVDATADTLGSALVFISIFFTLHRRRLLLDPFVSRLLSKLGFQFHRQRPLQVARVVAFLGVLGTIASIGALWESFVRKYVPLFEPNVVRYAPDLVPVEDHMAVRLGLFLWSTVCGDALLFLMVIAMACDLLWETAQYLCFVYIPLMLAILVYNLAVWSAVVLADPIAGAIWQSMTGPTTGL